MAFDKKLRNLAQAVQHELECHGLTPKYLRLLLEDQLQNKRVGAQGNGPHRLMQVAEALSAGRFNQLKRGDFRALVNVLSEALDLSFDIRPLRTTREKLVILAQHTVSIIAFISVLYLVLGGILEGKAALSSSVPITLIALLALILALAAFEGLQISATTLRLRDPHRFRHQYKRAYRLHQLFRSEMGMRRFLAGRQLFVVVIVFFAARATSFEDMATLPFTAVPFPSWMSPWFETLFLNLGIAGALLVLWAGQLLPQFFANKKPLALLNFPGMSLVLRLGFFVQSLGITRPGEWLTWRLNEEPWIPASSREAYRQIVEDVQGYGSVGLAKEWIISRNSAVLNEQHVITLKKGGFSRVLTPPVLYPTGDAEAKFDYRLVSKRAHVSSDDLLFRPNRFSSRLQEGWEQVQGEVEARWGSFAPGDVIIAESSIKFGSRCSGDLIRITWPTKYVAVRVEFHDEPKMIRDVKLRLYKIDDATGELTSVGDQELELQVDEAGNRFVGLWTLYPEIGTHYEITWSTEY